MPIARRHAALRQTGVFRHRSAATRSACWAGVRVVSAVSRQNCRTMRFETDPAMSRSAIQCQPIAARISRWSLCLTSRRTHPQPETADFLAYRSLREQGQMFRSLHAVHADTGPSASNARPLLHMAYNTTTSLRATATLARLNPTRSRSPRPQRRRALSVRARVRM